MNRSRDCHTEWSKPEGEKQISYVNTHIYVCVNCGVGGDSWEYLGWQGDPTSQS